MLIRDSCSLRRPMPLAGMYVCMSQPAKPAVVPRRVNLFDLSSN
jgi:hypothetical protein